MGKYISFCVITLLMSCESGPYKPDFDVAHFEIIGKEECYSDTVRNGWLISLTLLSSGKTYGPDIQYNGVRYSNVIKTYSDLSKEFVDSTDYACDFKIIGSMTTTCNVSSPEHTEIPVAEILELSVVYK